MYVYVYTLCTVYTYMCIIYTRTFAISKIDISWKLVRNVRNVSMRIMMCSTCICTR